MSGRLKHYDKEEKTTMNLNRNFYEADLWPNLHLYWTNLAKFESFQRFLILLCMKDTSAMSGLIYESFFIFLIIKKCKESVDIDNIISWKCQF